MRRIDLTGKIIDPISDTPHAMMYISTAHPPKYIDYTLQNILLEFEDKDVRLTIEEID